MRILVQLFSLLLLTDTEFIFAQANKEIPSSVSKLFFDENKNQWPAQVKFHAEIPGGNLFLENNTLTYLLSENVDFHGFGKTKMEPITVHYHAWKVKFENSNPAVQIKGDNQYSFVNNYYHGNDSSRWAENVKMFEKVKYENIYDNIDVNFYASDMHLKYDFIVNPGGDYNNIQMSYDGADSLYLSYGHFYIKTSLGMVIEQKPYAYQKINGEKKEIPCNYVLNLNDNQLGFSVGNYDKSLPLIIDPTLIAATYSGSPADHWGFTATYDAAGNIYSAGVACSAGYPTTVGASQATFGGGGAGGSGYPFDIAIIKYNPTGTTRLFATYYGGADNEQPHSMFVNANNELYVVGRTWSANFPTTAGAYDQSLNGGGDIIVGKFNTLGGLLASTFIGGSGDDGVNYNAGFYTFGMTKFSYADDGRSEIILDNASNVYIAASTQSSNFPTTAGAYDATLGGPQDGCVFKMNSNLSALSFSTYLGGSNYDGAYGLKLDAAGNVYVTGGTTSNNFPTTAGVIHTTFQGGTTDGFISELNSTGTSLLASTFLGTASDDQSYFLEKDASNNVYVFGLTRGAYQTTAGVYKNANSAQFIHKLNSSLTTTVFSTVVGTGSLNPNISPTAFLVDSCESIYIAGWGRCSQFQNPNPNTVTGMPITANAQQPTTDGCDFYFMVLTPDAKSLWYATFYGENGGFEPDHVDGGTSRFDRRAFIYQSVCGSCGGTSGFPTTPGAWSSTNNSSNCNNAVVKMDVSIHPIAVAILNGPNAGCAPFTASFTNTGSAASSFIWNFGDGSPIDTITSPSHTYTAVGTFTVTLYAIDSLGVCAYIDSAKLVISVGQPPALQMSQTSLLCFGTSNGTATVTTTGGLNPLTYLWSPGGQTTSAATGLSGATYSVTVTDNLGCSATNTITVNEPPPVTGSIINSINVSCFGGNDGSATASGSGGTGAITYSWTTIPTQTSLVASNLIAGNYSVTMTDANGCAITDNIIITQPPGMNLTSISTDAGCGVSNGTATISSSGGTLPYTYLWLTSPVQTTTTATGLSVGTYTVIVTDGKGCNQPLSVSVGGVLAPAADFYFNPDIVSYLNPLVAFTDASVGNPFVWFWNFGDVISGANNSSTLENPMHIFSDTGTYCITLIIHDSTHVCRDTIVKCLKVEADFTFYIPNCFTPNNDGINEMFFGYGTYIKEFHIMIFDRWGNLIFESHDINKGWDGKVQGGNSHQLVQEDVYVWKVNLVDVHNQPHQYIGHVSKVR
ncbi:MAG: gliding motility-associated C-terminal domain-containing protein [Bacteroidetes bacterium]|nr:gliding motility-associated C-terminal domain-containing protein [Bacteroidota bacterium]